MKLYKMRLLSIALVLALACNITYPMFGPTNNTHRGVMLQNMAIGLVLGSVMCVAAYTILGMLGFNPNPFAPGNPGGGNGGGNAPLDDPQDQLNIPKPPPLRNFKQMKREQCEKRRLDEEKHKDEKENAEEERKKLQAHVNKCRQLGIEDEIVPFVKDAKRVGNILYIQLDCVSQFCPTLQRPVQEYYDAMKQQILDTHNVQRWSQLTASANSQIRQLNGFQPSATCSSLVIRSLLKMKQFMLRQNLQDVSALDELINTEDGINYFQELLARDEPVSWGDATVFTGLLGVNLIERNNLQNETTFVQTALQANVQAAQIAIQAAVRNDSPFHLFVISTGDVGAFNLIDPAFDRVIQEQENNSDIILEPADRGKINRQEDSKRHYYAAAMQKRGNETRYYIIDTAPGKDHINNQDYHLRDRYLGETVAIGRPTVDFRAYLAGPYAEGVVRRFNRVKKLRKELKEKKKKEAEEKKKLEELMTQKQEEEEKKKKNAKKDILNK